MESSKLTVHNFDRENGMRHILRYEHGFEHADLERAKGIVGDAIAHVEHKLHTTGMGADHFESAMKFLNKDHAGWKKLPESQRHHIEAALKTHLRIDEPEKETA